MKTVSVSVLVLTLLIATVVARAATIVYPTGNFPADVQSVQAALDQGGIVLLKVTDASGNPTPFNFGPAALSGGFVRFHHDGELVGERVGDAMTTIAGGQAPVRKDNQMPIATAVRGIAFDAPFVNAIAFVAPPGASAEITGNRIAHVVGGAPFGPPTSGSAIVVVGGGRLIIADNIIEGVDADNGVGIEVFNSSGPVEIVRDQVSSTTLVAITAAVNQGVVRIEDNILRPGPTPNFFGGGGFGIDVEGTGDYFVLCNDVVIENPAAVGIFVFGSLSFGLGAVSNPVIQGNRVLMSPVGTIDGLLLNDGIDLVGLVSGAYVGQNRITGPGFSAFLLLAAIFDPSPPDLAVNTYVGNDIAGVQAQLADLFLDFPSHDNVLKGMSGTVIDLGTNNRITGFTKVAAPASGLQVSEAIRLRNRAVRFNGLH